MSAPTAAATQARPPTGTPMAQPPGMAPIANASSRNLPKTRVFVAAENRLLREALYRMKQEIGADDRLGIVQVCRPQGFMV